MIVYKVWRVIKKGKIVAIWDGWFLFGFIPIYMRVKEIADIYHLS